MGKEEALQLIKEAAETGATSINLMRQGLTEVPQDVFQLASLKRLYLRYNRLSYLPPEIVNLPKLKELYLRGNPLISPPYELAEKGISAIREYFAEMEGESKELAEVKIILVGEGASGKTSLVKRLRGQQFDPHEPMTHGISINKWRPASAGQLPCCNVWDFGGQEIMHATHQFFLSRRSLYVLVLDNRRDERPEYWLRYIETFGGESPVLVVLNKQDINPGFDLNQPFLRKKYPFIKGFWPLSCHSGQGMAEFTRALHEQLDNVPLSKNRWPATWFRAKEKLEQLHEPRINYERFEQICLEAGVKGATTRQVLVDFLNDLGTVIHFDQFELNDHHVLNPQWVTEAVYKIINAPSVAHAKGLLHVNALADILAKKKDSEHRYYPADHHYIIELMKKFKLCYALNDKEVLIPQLLAVPEPSFTFDYSNALRFVLHYEDFLPPSVMPRFIVNRHQEIHDNLRWRSGVVLKNAQLDASAVVNVDDEARRIHIAVTGKERKIFLALIWLTLREINTGFEGLKVSERVPMPDEPTITVAYESLLKSQEAGIEKVFPEDAKRAYTVKELLERVHFANESEGKQMLALAEGERKAGGLRGLIKKMNRYVEGNLELFGLKINYQNIAEDILNKEKKQP
uniref:COR domain-containing protein n=1 Tax=Candidatus Electronema sp. TaxID=2698783 RepID=UPI004055A30B